MAAVETKSVEVVSNVEDVAHQGSRAINTDSSAVRALRTIEFDHHISVRDSVRQYPKAIFWSLMVSMCVVMEGYDTILIPNFFAYPEFKKKYGVLQPDDTYQLTAPWQAALGNASGLGAFFGALLNGLLVEKFGQKRVVIGALTVLSAFIFIVFFADRIEVQFVGQLLCGLPWGIFATSAPAYASEVLPLHLRVYLTSYTNMCFIIGQLIAAGVLEGLVSRPDEWSYRIPFAIQWAWPAILIPILCFAPESPWHLVRVGKLKAAEKSLQRLQGSAAKNDIQATLAVIVSTNRLEQELSVGSSFVDCFKGVELRRTEIACMVFAGQILSGLLFAYNASYFFEQIGVATGTIYKLTLGGNSLALFGTIISWVALMPYFGRRTIYLSGMVAMTLILLIIGILSVRTAKSTVGMTQAVLTLAWTFVFQLSVGQLGWALPAEVGSTRLRQKTICLARNSYYIVSVIGSVLQPYFMNPTAWNLKGYTSFFWAATSLITTIWVFFRLPETCHRTPHELDLMFASRLPVRKFKSAETGMNSGQHDSDAGEMKASLQVATV